ncbi:GPI mannosyltransferase 3-like [Atheta coriaria]|uniref:GPI mannosyltransferase 3-like n=1 Tax=Dalotia coriaria TaxID=877792 RepID=UPI0031F33FA8
MKDRAAFGILLLIRILSVFIVSTWFVPDEYWQSLEVAHKFVYGYGYLSWEWTKGIRSYLHPGIIAIVYKILQLIGVDSTEMLIYVPRLLQATLSAFSDYCFWKWCGRTKWSMFCIGISWFWFYTASRTLLNTFETCLTTIALSTFPFQKYSKHEKAEVDSTFLWVVGLSVAIRPTAAILWLPLCAYQLFTSRIAVSKNLLNLYLPVSLLILIGSTAFDSILHGSFVVTWWEFFASNVLDGVGEFYGSHPWHWYLSQGLVAVLGVQVVPFLIATVRVLKHRHVFIDELALLASFTFAIFIYSFMGHKEFRFLMPLLPIALHISADFLTVWSRKASDWLVWLVAVVLLVGNALPAIYFSTMHQKGNLEVMTPLREIANKDPENTNILFLMPCHSTPLYSHLHTNVTVRFLTCLPNLSKVDNYQDEADYFYKNPSTWIRNNYPPNKPLPSHIVSFDALLPHLSDILSRYKPIHRIYNTEFVSDARIGRYVIVHELVPTNKGENSNSGRDKTSK